jgi:hypothetical protein
MNDKIIERLKKLLALAGNNPSQGEAEAAMAKAQEVAIEHGIDLAMLGASCTENESEIIREDMELGQRLPTVSNYVTNILTDFFNVQIISTGSRERGRKLCFIGLRDNVHTAKYIYTWLSETMVRCWHNYQDKTGVSVRHKQGYLFGFYTGLVAKLQANKRAVEADKLPTQEQQNKYAVAVADLQNKIQNFIADSFEKINKPQDKRIVVNQNSYDSGVRDGANCNIAKGGIGNRAVGQLAY